MKESLKGVRSVLVAATLALLVSGCAHYGYGGIGLEDVIRAGSRGHVVNGEVRRIDMRAGRMLLRPSRGGNRWVRFDRSTRVVYRQRSYPVNALERGDLVSARVEPGRRGEVWAYRVDVRGTVRDRGPRRRGKHGRRHSPS